MENQELEAVAIQMRREYQNEWRRKNRERVKAYNHKQWLKRAEAALAAQQSGEGNDDGKKD